MPTYPTSAVATIKKRCTAFPLDVQILDADGAPVDITAYTRVQFVMVLPVDGGADVAKVSAAGSVVDAATGKIRYTWVDADVDTAGEYVGEFTLLPTLPAVAPVLKVPTDSAILVKIVEDVEA